MNWKTKLTRRLLVAVVAVGMVALLATHELTFAKSARAATAAPAAAPLDDNSVAALLSLDRAMETLAARVTPAVVNVTVTSKEKRRKPATIRKTSKNSLRLLGATRLDAN